MITREAVCAGCVVILLMLVARRINAIERDASVRWMARNRLPQQRRRPAPSPRR